MSGPRIGELFAGYGGLGMGVQQVYGGEVVWVSEFDKGPSKILAHRFPGVPNHGDITKIDWAEVEPVDILTGGSPCQDLSHAGRRAGMTEGTRSNLWVAMREAIAQLRPRLVIWENVRGAYSAAADSAVEPCPGCVGDGTGVHLRALGRVLGDLADLGYDASWHGLRAADVGAPHGRFRVFVVAYRSMSLEFALGVNSGALGDGSPRNEVGRTSRTGTHGVPGVRHGYGSDAPAPDRAQQLLPTPRATDGTKGGPNQRGSSGDLMLPSAVALLPTPTVQDGANTGGASQFDRNSVPLNALVTLLPTPTATEGRKGDMGETATKRREAGHEVYIANALAETDRWGNYAAAIARWEHVLGRTAPEPTMTSTKGNPQLSPAFVEWMMGLPAGWVTDVPEITRNEALKALGNGVVPQQAAEALRVMAAWSVAA